MVASVGVRNPNTIHHAHVFIRLVYKQRSLLCQKFSKYIQSRRYNHEAEYISLRVPIKIVCQIACLKAEFPLKKFQYNFTMTL